MKDTKKEKRLCKKVLENTKGITLIALVVTIMLFFIRNYQNKEKLLKRQ